MTLFRAAIVLGLLSAVGPFAIDMYLPALPAIGKDLQAEVSAVQYTLIAYFVAFGLSQLVYGPWADQAGRKVPLYFGISIFILGSLGCAFASSISELTAFRFLQGMGGAVLMVIPRAVIRDMHTGTQATKLMAMVMLVVSVSPMLAPLLGAGLIAIGDWRLIFWVLCLAGMVTLVITSRALPETLAPSDRVRINLGSLMAGAGVLMRDPVFVGLTFIGGFGFASFMIFIASASFVYTAQFGLTPTWFSVAFAFNAIGFFAASQAAGPLGERFGILPVMRFAIFAFALSTGLLFVVVAMGFVSLPIVVVGLFIANACLGLVIPTAMVVALDDHGDIAGLASSLGGTLQMLSGGVMVAAVGPFFDGTATPMIGAIALCGVLALILSVPTFRVMGRAST